MIEETVDAKRGAWWHRNRLWLALLLPLLVLALAASSFRLVTLYLPWQWSRPVIAGDVVGVLHQNYLELDGQRRDREVQVEVRSVERHESFDETKAVDGAALWVVSLELRADPDQFLYGCEVELTDAAGDRYDFRSSLEHVDEDGFYLSPALVPCVPEEAPGPTVEPFTGKVVPSPVERPAAWREEVLIAMPEGKEPDAVRIGWSRPDYLVLDIP